MHSLLTKCNGVLPTISFHIIYDLCSFITLSYELNFYIIPALFIQFLQCHFSVKDEMTVAVFLFILHFIMLLY